MRTLRRRGTNLIETALVMPFIFMVLIGIIEYCRFYYTQAVLYNAAREGARYGSIHPTDTSGISGSAKALTIGLPSASINVVTLMPSGTASGSPITVEVSYAARILTPQFNKNLTLVRSATMRIE